MSKDKAWYYVDAAGRQQGPLTEDALLELIGRQQITRQTLVWHDGLTDWMPFMEALTVEAKAAPSPPPRPAVTQPVASAAYTRPTPWRRYFAKYIDIMLCAFVMIFVFVWLMTVLGLHDAADKFNELLDNGAFAAIVASAFWCVGDAVILSTTGTTLGRWIFGIRLRKVDGSTLTFTEALKRNVGVWVHGMGFGIPIVTIITCLMSYSKLTKTGTTTWDTDANTIVEPDPGSMGPMAGLFLLVVGIMAMVGYFSSK